MLIGMPPGMQRTAWSKKLPSPPLAWSAMLSARTFWYSGVSGACCPKPHGLVWSNDGCPPSPGTTNRAHAPRQSGYFASAACAPPIGSTNAATAMAPINPRQSMVNLPRSDHPSISAKSRRRMLAARWVALPRHICMVAHLLPLCTCRSFGNARTRGTLRHRCVPTSSTSPCRRIALRYVPCIHAIRHGSWSFGQGHRNRSKIAS